MYHKCRENSSHLRQLLLSVLTLVKNHGKSISSNLTISSVLLTAKTLMYAPPTTFVRKSWSSLCLKVCKGYCGMCRVTKSYSHKGSWRNLARNKRKSLLTNIENLTKQRCVFGKSTVLFKSYMRITQRVKSATSVLPQCRCNLKMSKSRPKAYRDLLIKRSKLPVLKLSLPKWYTSLSRKSWYTHPNTRPVF